VSAPELLCLVPNPSIDRTADVERLVPGAIHRPTDLVSVPGGKGLNVARAAALLGVRARAAVLLAGHAGRWIDDALDRAGIPHTATWVEGETRTCLSVLDRSTGLLTEVYEPGPGVDDDGWRRFLDDVRAAIAALPAGSLVALSGSLPPGVAAAGAAALVELATDAGLRALVDTSGPALAAAIDARPFLVKVNAAEAGAHVGVGVAAEEDALRAAAGMRASGVEVAIVTRGAEGAVAVERVGAWTAVPPSAGPYAVGSGDAFLAAVADGILRGLPLDALIRRATAAGAASTLVRGQGELRIEDVERLERAVEVRAIGAPRDR